MIRSNEAIRSSKIDLRRAPAALRRRRDRWGLGLAAACLALALTGGGVLAQEQVDQRNMPSTGTTYGCGSSGASIFQSFTPGAGNLSSLELQMRAGGGFPDAGVTLGVVVRRDDPAGMPLGTGQAVVTGPLAPGAPFLARFAFNPPLPLDVGALHVIELSSPAPAGEPAARIASWYGAEGNPYPRGQAFGCSGNAVADRDQNFVTYASPEALAPTPEPTPPSVVCPQILGRVPPAAIAAALADPSSVEGHDQLQDPGKPEGPFNPRRLRLSLRALALPYHPLFNGLVYRAGCP